MQLNISLTRMVWERYTMKMAFENPPAYPLQNDITTLQALQNANHVVNLKAVSASNSPNPAPTSFRPHLNPFSSAGLRYEHYLIEYMPNGSLERFIERVSANQLIDRFSNRFLFHIFLCAARACAAMAWTPERKLDAFGFQLPEAEQERPPLPFVHGAIRPGHWLFGSIDEHSFEHTHVPIMKLAGFDESYVQNDVEPRMPPVLPSRSAAAAKGKEPPPAPEFDLKAGIVKEGYSPMFPPLGTFNLATQINVLNVGVLMANIVLEDDGRLTADEVRQQLGPRDKWNRNTDPGYDPDLLELIAMCIAVDPNNRPTISELLGTLKVYVAERDGRYYVNRKLPGFERETNGYLRRLVQTYMYDASDAE
ncbi:hypothetical protein PG984_005620 [Apiospora sp. TS-2023a]